MNQDIENSSSSEDEEYAQRKKQYLDMFRESLKKELGAETEAFVEEEIRKSTVKNHQERHAAAEVEEEKKGNESDEVRQLQKSEIIEFEQNDDKVDEDWQNLAAEPKDK